MLGWQMNESVLHIRTISGREYDDIRDFSSSPSVACDRNHFPPVSRTPATIRTTYVMRI
ncbi:hypothetical protein L209DRAFT_753076 [Thermothelomyces heterothallicus CBS 203.75]